MYLKRKIDNELDEWLNGDSNKPALVVGIRQCGKTKTIEELARRNKKNLFKLNFWDNPVFCYDFDGQLDVDTIILNISLRNPQIEINPKNTILFFDEIQECPRARLAFKNFAMDGRYKVIGSGSYLGINGYVVGDSTPIPVGYEEIFEMKTMDFEEFLWANGFNAKHIDQLQQFFDKKEEIPQNIHNIYRNQFKNYMCVGGFPEVVSLFLETKNLVTVNKKLNSLIFEMKSDFGRRIGKNGKPLFKPGEISRIQNAFDLIPTFLAKENKRFIVSKISSGNSQEKNDAIEYLKQAHIVNKVFNVETPSLPFKGNVIPSQFKLFPEDIGLLVAMFGIDSMIGINKNQEMGQSKGAIFEGAVFDCFIKSKIDCFYFAKQTGLEIDFVICYKGCSYLVEAKSKSGNTKSAKTVMSHPDHYGKTKLIKIGDYNVSESGDIITIPHYLTFLLGR